MNPSLDQAGIVVVRVPVVVGMAAGALGRGLGHQGGDWLVPGSSRRVQDRALVLVLVRVLVLVLLEVRVTHLGLLRIVMRRRRHGGRVAIARVSVCVGSHRRCCRGRRPRRVYAARSAKQVRKVWGGAAAEELEDVGVTLEEQLGKARVGGV